MTTSTNAQISSGSGVPAAEGSGDPPALYCIDPSTNLPESAQVYTYLHPMFSYVPVPIYPVVLIQPVEVPVTITSSPLASSAQVQQHEGGQKILDPLTRNWSRYANVKPSEFSRKGHHQAAGNSSDETGSPSERKGGITWRRGIGNFELPLLASREARGLTPFERLLQRVGRGPGEVARSDDAVVNLLQAQQLPVPTLPDVNRSGSHGSDGSGSDQGLSLPLSSHQQQPGAVHIKSCWSKEDLNTGAALPDSEKVTAEVNVDEEQHSRSVAGVAMDLSRFRTGGNSVPVPDVAGRFTKGSEDSSSEYTDASKAGHLVRLRENIYLISTSKYLLPVQDLLSGVCNASTFKSKNQGESVGQASIAIGDPAAVTVAECSSTPHGRGDLQVTSVACEDPVTRVALPTDASPTAVTVSHKDVNRIKLTETEEIELRTMKGKLGMMLLEVERRYEQYSEQVETLTTGFNSIAGQGTAASYTGLAVQAISRHFRFLRDAIFRQLRLVKIALGDDDAHRSRRGETPGLHCTTHQQFRQRLGALRQLGMPHLLPSIKPVQRGLPEVAVAVLRAWMFEHFLHPYPKGADKLSLAEQAGLTRNQVSNWFINARVRLWKPMVEEMYLEESREMEAQALLYARGKSENLQDIHQLNGENRDDDMPLNTQGNDQSYVYVVPDLNYVDEDQMRIPGPAGAVISEARSQEGTREKQQQFAHERGSVDTSNKRPRDVDQERQLVTNDSRSARPAASSEELTQNETSSPEKNVTQTIELSACLSDQTGMFNKTNEKFDGVVCTQGVPVCSDGRPSQQVEERMSVSHEDIQLEIFLGECTNAADRPSEEHLANPGEGCVEAVESMRSSKDINSTVNGGTSLTLLNLNFDV